VEAFLPNPGRLWEILLPGTELLLSMDGKSDTRKTVYTAVAAKREDILILLHTHMTNDASDWLLRRGKVPGLEGWRIEKREASLGRSRFDFLMEKEGKKLYLEVKSCTLFGSRLAMFPDAPSVRGRKHVEELAAMEGGGAVLILVQSGAPRFFLPDFHTDPKFAESLYKNRDRLEIIPLAVSWSEGLALSGETRRLEIPWEVYEKNRACPGVTIVTGERGGRFWAYAADGKRPSAGLKEIVVKSDRVSAGQINRELAAAADGCGEEDGGKVFYFSGPPLKNPDFAALLLYHRTDGMLEGDGD
jgi:sugar fermentation stimulation protein A